MRGDIRGWWKDRDAAFSTGRIGDGVATTDAGVDVHVQFNDRVELNAGFSELERDGIGTDRVARIQFDAEGRRWYAGIEARYEDVERDSGVSQLSGRSGDGEALLVGGRLGVRTSERTELYVEGQVSTDERGEYEDNDRIGVGINTALSPATSVSLEASDGDRGSAITAGIDVAAREGLRLNLSGGFGAGAISQFGTSYNYGEGRELYATYSVDPDRTEGPRDLLTLGQRRQFGNHTRIFTESQFAKKTFTRAPPTPSASISAASRTGVQRHAAAQRP